MYAIKHAANLKALYVLTGVQDLPDGSRDLHFTLIGSNTGTTATEFLAYTGGYVRKYTADGAFENLPPEWDLGPGA